MRPWIIAIVLALFSLNRVSAQSVEPKDGFYKVDYSWDYNDGRWAFSVSVPEEIYDYYRGRTHYNDDLMHFVLSEYDRDYIREIVKSFRAGGEEWGLSDMDNLFNVVAFVQSLQYVSDEASKGEEDYVRYPIETLVDGVGDCEDVVILAASLLHEMGYSVLLVSLPEHLALAVKYENYRGTCFNYKGGKYYYLEMTSPGWKLGQVPPPYQKKCAKLIPIVDRPVVEFGRCGYWYDDYYAFADRVEFEISCEVENKGPGATQGLSIQVVVKRNADATETYANKTFNLEDLPEAGKATFKLKLPVSRPAKGVVVLRLKGENFDTDTFVLEGLELK